MTNAQIDSLTANLQTLHTKSIESDERYRTARARKFLEMAIPTDGSKKPADEVIKARLDADSELILLRRQMETDAAELSVAQYYYKAVVFNKEA